MSLFHQTARHAPGIQGLMFYGEDGISCCSALEGKIRDAAHADQVIARIKPHACEQMGNVCADALNEPAVARIAKALAALVAALPDVTYLTIGAAGHMSIACGSDESARALAATIGREVREVGNNTHRWLDAGSRSHDGILISIYGPHHERARVEPIDELRVSAALTQIEAVL